MCRHQESLSLMYEVHKIHVREQILQNVSIVFSRDPSFLDQIFLASQMNIMWSAKSSLVIWKVGAENFLFICSCSNCLFFPLTLACVFIISNFSVFIGADNIRASPSLLTGNSVQDIVSQLSKELLWVEAKDVWCIHLDPVWGEFYGTRAVGSNRPTCFFDALPITLWVYMKPPQETMVSYFRHTLRYLSSSITNSTTVPSQFKNQQS